MNRVSIGARALAAVLMTVELDTLQAQAPKVQRDFSIGCAVCGAATEFERIEDVALSVRGDILVATSNAPMLRYFDAAGKSLWQIGAKGKGPGEYTAILRAAVQKNGGVLILDASGFRVTSLGPTRTVVSTTPMSAYPTTAGITANGGLLIGAEGRREGFSLARWSSGAITSVGAPITSNGQTVTDFRNVSIALSESGVTAVLPHVDRYEIIRFDSAGRRLPDVIRKIDRVAYAAEEMAENAEQSRKRDGQMAAMMAARTGSKPKAVTPIGGSSAATHKSHVAADGLRFDSSGRLWVLTGRGNATSSVFDVFAPAGSFLGSVTVNEGVRIFALHGGWLVTSSENDEGVPVVTRWSVR